MKDKIEESKEDYLETILILQNRNGSVRAVDIAAEMDFSKPSVSVAMKKLRQDECISVDENGLITLTERGRELAELVYNRHQLFSEWLISLGVGKEIATQDACRIEHVISTESFAAIRKYVEKHGYGI